MIKIHILHTGRVSVDIGVPLKQKNPLAVTGFFRSEKNRVWLPVSTYLIEHPKGLVLIDTGWHTDKRQIKMKKHLGLLPISYADLPEGMAINEQLSRLGYKTSDLDYVFISHMDGDHIDGLRLVSDAKNIMVSEEEWQDSQNKLYFYRYKSSYIDGVNVNRFHFSESGIGPYGKSYDVFGDNTVLLVSTPGHSHGLFTTLVQGEDKFVAIIGDTGYMKKSWEELWLPGLTVDSKAAKRSLEWIKEISNYKNCAKILATHDPEIKPHTIEI